jgi:arabinofuranosyltransferase
MLRPFQVFITVLPLAGTAVGLALRSFGYPTRGTDDANIFLVYAKNFVGGHGFVYNIGGERVEGFSSLLWTLIGAGLYRINSHPELAILLLNTLLVTAGCTIAVCYLLSPAFLGTEKIRSHTFRYFWASLYVVLIFSSPAFMTWNTITLMENGLWSTLLLCSSIAVVGERHPGWKSSVLLTLLLILMLPTRPESYLWGLVFIAIFFMRLLSRGSLRHTLILTFPPIAAFSLGLLSLTLFRMDYFGYPLPNTYYAKVSPQPLYNAIEGFMYLLHFFVSGPVECAVVISIVLTVLHGVRRVWGSGQWDQGPIFYAVIGLVGLLLPLLTGGDHFYSYRLYQNVYPILLISLIVFLCGVLPEYVNLTWNPPLSLGIRCFILISLVLASVLLAASQWKGFGGSSGLQGEFDLVARERSSGEYALKLFKDLPSLPSLGVVPAGAIKVAYPGEVIDLMGLNNLRMAHNSGERKGMKNHAAFEKATFYELLPDIVIPEHIQTDDRAYTPSITRTSHWNRVLKGILFDQPFKDLYVYTKAERLGSNDGEALIGWFSRDLIARLTASGTFDLEVFEYHHNK